MRVTRLPAWSASTKHDITIGIPRALRTLGGIASFASG